MAIIKKESFGKLSDGREAFLYTLRNTKGTEVKVTNYGARLVSWSTYAKDYQKVDIVLGYADALTYEKDDTSMGGVGPSCQPHCRRQGRHQWAGIPTGFEYRLQESEPYPRRQQGLP